MRIRALRFKLCLTAFVIISVVLGLHLTVAAQICSPGSGICVTTWQQDTGVPDIGAGYVYRTGENLMESRITASTISSNGFGQICSTDTVKGGPLDGQLYAQPLVLTNTTLSTHPVVYVVTQNDTLYAIDGTSCALLKMQSLLPSGQTAVPCGYFVHGPCNTIKPTVGILGTPVIDQTTWTIYLVTHSIDSNGKFYHYLHALDVQSLIEKFNGPMLICPTGQTCPSTSGFSSNHIQRPALLLANCGSACGNQNYVYVAFSMMDGAGNPPPNGAIFAYQASNLGLNAPFQFFQTSLGGQPLSSGGGIWMGAAGPAFGPDGSGNNWVYLTTANGTFDPVTGNWGDSFLKLNPSSLTVATNSNGQLVGFLTPTDQNYRSDYNDTSQGCNGDWDFGSGGVTLIPDNELTYPNYGYMAVNGEKEGNLWFIRRDAPGEFIGSYTGCAQGGGGPNVQTYAVNSNLQVIHNNIAFWESESGQIPTKPFVYVAPQNATQNMTQNYLYQFTLCTTPTDNSPICGSAPSAHATLSCCTYGITPTISAASPQATDGILWAIEKTDGGCAQADSSCSGATPYGILYAFDAVTLAPLYSSPNNTMNQATKFSVPTVANGCVYVGTQSNNSKSSGKGTLYIFSTLTPQSCQ